MAEGSKVDFQQLTRAGGTYYLRQEASIAWSLKQDKLVHPWQLLYGVSYPLPLKDMQGNAVWRGLALMGIDLTRMCQTVHRLKAVLTSLPPYPSPTSLSSLQQ